MNRSFIIIYLFMLPFRVKHHYAKT